MEIITEGHDNKNAVLQIMQLFFSLDEDVRAVSVLKSEGGEVVSEAEISLGGITVKGRAVTTKTERLDITNTVKKAVFWGAKKISDMPTPWGISTGIRPAKAARKLLDSMDDDKIKEYLEEEYLISEEKAELSVKVAKKEADILKGMRKNSVSIYVGIPFCPTRCAYCSFISQATEHNKKFIEPYTRALTEEIRHTGKIVKALDMAVDCVYFGGGTPTAIEPYLLKKLIESVKENFDMSHMREFTVEAGRPDTFSKEMMNMLAEEKIDRICVNPQSMHQATLDRVGRRHSVEDVKRAFYLAREAGIKSINADIIAGLPGEDKQMMEETLDELLNLTPEAVTVHTLYMKRAADMIADFNSLRFKDNINDIMDCAVGRLEGEGFEPYYMYKQRNTLGNLENVGFAKKGHESIYNVYIMEEVQPILAMGAGGSTKMVSGDEIERIFNPKDAADYTNRIEEVLKRKNQFLNFYNTRRKLQ